MREGVNPSQFRVSDAFCFVSASKWLQLQLLVMAIPSSQVLTISIFRPIRASNIPSSTMIFATIAGNLADSFTAPQAKTYFKNVLGMEDKTIAAIKKMDGIKTPKDLGDYDEDDAKTIFANLRKPPQVIAPTGHARAGTLIDQEPFPMSAKSQKRFVVLVRYVTYLKMTGRELDADSGAWDVLASFSEQYDALKQKSEADEPDVPKLTKGMAFIKWIESFKLHLNAIVGCRGCPLVYVVRTVHLDGGNPPARLANEPHSKEYGSVEGELIALLTHDHPLFKNDNSAVYDRLDIALRGSDYHSAIIRFRKERDGAGAYHALTAQNCGQAVWEKRITESENSLKRTWTGTSSVTLKRHIDLHRKSFVDMQEAGTHVKHQIPEERTRVTYLLDSIGPCKDPEVLSGAAAIRRDDPGMRDHFEQSATFLLPTCPVARKGSKGRGTQAEVAAAESGLGKGKGATGVEFRWHPRKEFMALTEEQRDELKAWQAKNKAAKKAAGAEKDQKKRPAAGGQGSVSNKKLKRMVASAIKRQEKDSAKAETKSDELAKSLVSLVSSIATKNGQKKVEVAASAANPQEERVSDETREISKVVAGQLQSILKPGRNGKKSTGS